MKCCVCLGFVSVVVEQRVTSTPDAHCQARFRRGRVLRVKVSKPMATMSNTLCFTSWVCHVSVP